MEVRVGVREQNKKLPFVITVLLNWNKWEYTAECLRSLQNLDYLNNQTVVVDNGSTNDSVTRLRSLFPDVTLITNEENLGFAAGCNVGIRYALNQGADYVWLLNNDTVVHPHALTALVERAESDPQIGAVGSVIYDWERRDKILAWGGGRISYWSGRSRHVSVPVENEKLDFLTGASILIRREALGAIGLLDERFFLYWEDADFSIRLKKKSWKLAVATHSKVWHRETATVGRGTEFQDYVFNVSATIFLRKHARFSLLPIFCLCGGRTAKRFAAGHFRRGLAVLGGILCGLRVPVTVKTKR
jgi:GT2 family glycosyltransferase